MRAEHKLCGKLISKAVKVDLDAYADLATGRHVGFSQI